MKNDHNNIKGVFTVIIACFLWGTTGTAASYAPDVSPLAIGAFSMGLGGVLLVIKSRKKLLVDYKCMLQHAKIVALGAISVAIYPLAFYSSMRLSGVAIGTVVSLATAPFFAALLECLISKKAISRQWLVGFVIGAIGITLLALGRDQVTTDAKSHSINLQSLGILLGCVAGLAYAAYAWLARYLIERGVHSASSMSGLFGCAALFLFPSLWFTGDTVFSSTTNIVVSLYIAIIPTFLGYLLFGYGLNFIDASKATLITLLEPLVATALAVFILGERFKLIGWVGAALVLLCLLIQTFKSKHSDSSVQS